MDTPRRALLVAGAAALAAFKVAAASSQTGQQEELMPPLDGDFRSDIPSRTAAADDFGHLVHRTPDAVLLPGSDRTWPPRSGGPPSEVAQSRRRDSGTRCLAVRRRGGAS